MESEDNLFSQAFAILASDNGIFSHETAIKKIRTPSRMLIYLYFEVFDLGYLSCELNEDSTISLVNPDLDLYVTRSRHIGDWILSWLRRRIKFIPSSLQLRWFITKYMEDLGGRTPLNQRYLKGLYLICKGGLFHIFKMTQGKMKELGFSSSDENEVIQLCKEKKGIFEGEELTKLQELLTRKPQNNLTVASTLALAREEIFKLTRLEKHLIYVKEKAKRQKMGLSCQFLDALNSFEAPIEVKLQKLEKAAPTLGENVRAGQLSKNILKFLATFDFGQLYLKKLTENKVVRVVHRQKSQMGNTEGDKLSESKKTKEPPVVIVIDDDEDDKSKETETQENMKDKMLKEIEKVKVEEIKEASKENKEVEIKQTKTVPRKLKKKWPIEIKEVEIAKTNIVPRTRNLRVRKTSVLTTPNSGVKTRQQTGACTRQQMQMATSQIGLTASPTKKVVTTTRTKVTKKISHGKRQKPKGVTVQKTVTSSELKTATQQNRYLPRIQKFDVETDQKTEVGEEMDVAVSSRGEVATKQKSCVATVQKMDVAKDQKTDIGMIQNVDIARIQKNGVSIRRKSEVLLAEKMNIDNSKKIEAATSEKSYMATLQKINKVTHQKTDVATSEGNDTAQLKMIGVSKNQKMEMPSAHERDILNPPKIVGGMPQRMYFSTLQGMDCSTGQKMDVEIPPEKRGATVQKIGIAKKQKIEVASAKNMEMPINNIVPSPVMGTRPKNGMFVTLQMGAGMGHKMNSVTPSEKEKVGKKMDIITFKKNDFETGQETDLLTSSKMGVEPFQNIEVATTSKLEVATAQNMDVAPSLGMGLTTRPKNEVLLTFKMGVPTIVLPSPKIGVATTQKTETSTSQGINTGMLQQKGVMTPQKTYASPLQKVDSAIGQKKDMVTSTDKRGATIQKMNFANKQKIDVTTDQEMDVSTLSMGELMTSKSEVATAPQVGNPTIRQTEYPALQHVVTLPGIELGTAQKMYSVPVHKMDILNLGEKGGAAVQKLGFETKQISEIPTLQTMNIASLPEKGMTTPQIVFISPIQKLDDAPVQKINITNSVEKKETAMRNIGTETEQRTDLSVQNIDCQTEPEWESETAQKTGVVTQRMVMASLQKTNVAPLQGVTTKPKNDLLVTSKIGEGKEQKIEVPEKKMAESQAKNVATKTDRVTRNGLATNQNSIAEKGSQSFSKESPSQDEDLISVFKTSLFDVCDMLDKTERPKNDKKHELLMDRLQTISDELNCIKEIMKETSQKKEETENLKLVPFKTEIPPQEVKPLENGFKKPEDLGSPQLPKMKFITLNSPDLPKNIKVVSSLSKNEKPAVSAEQPKIPDPNVLNQCYAIVDRGNSCQNKLLLIKTVKNNNVVNVSRPEETVNQEQVVSVLMKDPQVNGNTCTSSLVGD